MNLAITPRAMMMPPSMFQWIRIGHIVRRAAALSEKVEASGQEHAVPACVPTDMPEKTLPRSVPLRAVAGLGSGLACALCDAVIVDTESEFEVYFLTRPFEPHFFHGSCYVRWLGRVVPGSRKVAVHHAA